jgi:glycosyltransferase involved in cell wall biosynthesis
MRNEFAPIIIPTLNRIEHLKRCITSLQNNKLANQTELVISVDYPPNDKYVEGYQKVREYLEQGITGFANVVILYQEKNLGPYDNSEFLLSYVKQRGYTTYIYSEDDNEFSPNFLEYVNKGLEIFEPCDDILAICGGATPRRIVGYNGTITRTMWFSAHGYGTWFKSEEQYDKEITRDWLIGLARKKSFLRKMWEKDPSLFYSYKGALLQDQPLYITTSDAVPKIDMIVKMYYMDQEKYCIAPVIPTSRTRGDDGSGVNCPRVENSKLPDLDLSPNFVYTETNPNCIPEHAFYHKKTFMDYVRYIGCMVKIKLYLFSHQKEK